MAGLNMNASPNELRAPGAALLMLSPEARLRRQAGVVLCHVAEKHMLVPAMTNKVDLDSLFLLNDTGSFIWEHLDGRRRVRNLGTGLAKAYALDPETATADVTRFLSCLLEHNLVEMAEIQWR